MKDTFSGLSDLINRISQIGPKYIGPFFDSIALIIAILISSVSGMNLEHEFAKPVDVPFSGTTIEITADYIIVKGANASAAENTAATKLHDYLEQINGTHLEIVTDATAPAELEIIVGKTNREGNGYTVDRTALGNEGVYIKTVGKRLVLSGGEERGTLYAVYTFLEDYFDCRWFTYNLTVIPKAEKLLIPADISYTYVPPFYFRQTDWISPARSVEYKVANGLNDSCYGRVSASMGGCVSYAGQFCHTMALLIPTSLFEEDETMFALHDGIRTTDQPCLTNPKTLETAIKSVRAWLEANPDATIISVTQNDNQNYCVCDKCKAIDEEEGSQAGTMLRFVNAIADDIKDDYPDVYVDTFAYQYTRKPCKITVPRDNVIVRLCSIECAFSTSLASGISKENKEFVDDIAQWSKLSDNLFIWDYTTNYGHYLTPFANFDVLQKNMQFFAENNVKGVYEEGNYEAAASDGEFAELRCYILSKLMWNPYCDIDELMYDFCEAYYGDGYQNIIDFINIIDRDTGCEFGWKWFEYWIFPVGAKYNKGLGIGYDPAESFTSINTDKELAEIDKLWENALAAASTADEVEHVERSQICWRYWKACKKVGEFSKNDETARIAANEEFYNDIKAFGIRKLDEGADGNLNPEPDFTLTPADWAYDPNNI